MFVGHIWFAMFCTVYLIVKICNIYLMLINDTRIGYEKFYMCIMVWSHPFLSQVLRALSVACKDGFPLVPHYCNGPWGKRSLLSSKWTQFWGSTSSSWTRYLQKIFIMSTVLFTLEPMQWTVTCWWPNERNAQTANSLMHSAQTG